MSATSPNARPGRGLTLAAATFADRLVQRDQGATGAAFPGFEFGRNGADIERSTLWQNAYSADTFREAGVTLFQTELTSDNGYDLASLKQVLTWRDNG